ncbi:putative nuclease HARBI1 [Mya arenaria]|uniref:putative nuclease HARBI1 n=1 Tax=Mya arenaria TaxID=6604 RepID=UPI0022E404D8|nr:putative nuclease HARBI1 [Mya arenaria]
MSNPLEDLREEEIFARIRFWPDTIYFIVDLCPAAARDTGRCFAIPLVLCVLSYLRCLATGAFQLTVGDTVNLSHPTVSRVCRQVGQVLSALADRYICFPSGDRVRQVKQQFGAMAGFPNVVGVIDCTHLTIKKPSANPEDYIGRKGVPTINVQAVLRRKLNCSQERACMNIRNCITLHNLGIDRRDIDTVDPIDPNDNTHYHGVDVGDNIDGRAAREYVIRMYFER